MCSSSMDVQLKMSFNLTCQLKSVSKFIYRKHKILDNKVLFLSLYWTVCHKQKVVLLMRLFKNHMRTEPKPSGSHWNWRGNKWRNSFSEGKHASPSVSIQTWCSKGSWSSFHIETRFFLKTAFYLHCLISEQQRGEKTQTASNLRVKKWASARSFFLTF